jgi:hypothetical protein
MSQMLKVRYLPRSTPDGLVGYPWRPPLKWLPIICAARRYIFKLSSTLVEHKAQVQALALQAAQIRVEALLYCGSEGKGPVAVDHSGSNSLMLLSAWLAQPCHLDNNSCTLSILDDMTPVSIRDGMLKAQSRNGGDGQRSV